MTVQKTETGYSDSDVVHDVKMDYYGQRLATASSDTTVKIMGLSNNSPPQVLATLIGHHAAVLRVSWAHPTFGSILASCSCDGRVIIWKEGNPNKWAQTQVFHEHKSSVTCISWAPHELGLCLACGSSDGSISILTARSDGCWDTNRIDHAHADGVTSLLWAPATAPGALAGSGLLGLIHKLASGGCDNTVRVWKLDNGTWKLVGFPCPNTHSDSVRDEVGAPSTKSRVAKASDDDVGPGECRRNRWLFEEDELLISTWLNIRMDPIGGNDQKMVSFWKRLAKLYEENRTGGITRTWRQLKQRWHRMIREVKKFIECYKKAARESWSDMDEKEIIGEAHRLYRSQNDGRRFVFEHSWMLLKDEPKWKAYVNILRNEGSFKRTKVFEAGASTASSNPDTLTSADVGSLEVPDIQPMSKPSKCKRKLNDEGKSKVLAEELHEIKSAEFKKAVAMGELAKTKQMEIDMQIIYKDTSSMNEEQLKFHVQLVQRLKQKYLL